MMVKSAVGVPAGVFHAMFTMINLERFELTPESNGQLLSYIGVLTMVCNTLFICIVVTRLTLSITDNARLWCRIFLQEVL